MKEYIAEIEQMSVPKSETTCISIYAVYRTEMYYTNDGCPHLGCRELFNVYTDRDVAEKVMELIEQQ